MSTIQKEKFQIHNYDSSINAVIRRIEKETSPTNLTLILKYDKVMVRESLAKPTRKKHLEVLLSLNRFLQKDSKDVTKDVVEELVYEVMLKYSPQTGQETNSTWDHKKVLKIFFRWFKLGSRQFRIVGDPDRESYTVGYVAIEEDYFDLYKPVYDNAISSLQIKDVKVSEPAPSFFNTPYETSSEGGGCLIATATYGSELAPQVQQLRELRDNKLLQTETGTSFMKSFNEFYYSFSPTIADYERENPLFKEAVKITITPLLTSLSILNYVDMETDAEVLGYGISLILLNVGMYVGVPAIVVVGIRKRF